MGEEDPGAFSKRKGPCSADAAMRLSRMERDLREMPPKIPGDSASTGMKDRAYGKEPAGKPERKRIMKRMLGVLIAMMLLLGICTGDGPAGPMAGPDLESMGITGYDAFSDMLAAKLIDGGRNSCLSPVSVYLALAMTAEGAGGETQAAILKLLGAGNIEDLRETCGTMLEKLAVDTEGSMLALADSLWMADQGGSFAFREEYRKVLEEIYRSEAKAVDFSREATGRLIAEWITGHTMDKIRISPDAMRFSPDTSAVLINTILLMDAWGEEFYEGATEEGTFDSPGGEQTVDYMRRRDCGVMIVRGEQYLRYSIPLMRTGRMTFVLPDEGMALSDMTGTPEQMHWLLHGGEEIEADVNLKLPKFRFQDRFELEETLKNLGMGIAFSDRADFSRMADFPSQISRVLQESFIGIDEKGVEAAAYTMVAMNETAALPQELPEVDFFLTRPFLYAVEAYDGTVLFIGTVTDPATGEKDLVE